MDTVEPLVKEAIVRELLGRRFGTVFYKRVLELASRRRDGSPIRREFDGVSADGRIVVEVKSDKHTDKAYATTRFPRAMLACRYLERATADRTLMVFTDRDFYAHFASDADGLIDPRIEVVHADSASNTILGLRP